MSQRSAAWAWALPVRAAPIMRARVVLRIGRIHWVSVVVKYNTISPVWQAPETRGSGLSIPGQAGIQLGRPGVYPTLQVGYLAEALGGQERRHLLAARAVMAHDHGDPPGVQFREPLRDLAHGDVKRALHVHLGVFPGFPHVQERGAVLEEGLGAGRVHLEDCGHQNRNTRGAAAFLRAGRSVSKRPTWVQASSAVRVTSRASITGEPPTITNSRPPTVRRSAKEEE